MALTDDEMQRVRRELDENVLDIGAEPYVWHKRIFDVIKSNVSASATAATSTSTAITNALIAAGTTTITVVSASGLSVGTKVQLDVDGSRETCTIKSLSGLVIGLNPRKTHAGTYPVEIESALTMLRGLLWDLSFVQDQINVARASGGIKRADEVEFFGPNDGGGRVAQLREEQRRLRNDLAGMLNMREMAKAARGGGGDVEVY
jgi:hypothetical protein